MAPPFRMAEFDIMFNEGISLTGSLLDTAVENEIIEKKGAWFNFKENKLGQGREAVKETLKKDKNLYNTIEKLILQKIKDN